MSETTAKTQPKNLEERLEEMIGEELPYEEILHLLKLDSDALFKDEKKFSIEEMVSAFQPPSPSAKRVIENEHKQLAIALAKIGFSKGQIHIITRLSMDISEDIFDQYSMEKRSSDKTVLSPDNLSIRLYISTFSGYLHKVWGENNLDAPIRSFSKDYSFLDKVIIAWTRTLTEIRATELRELLRWVSSQYERPNKNFDLKDEYLTLSMAFAIARNLQINELFKNHSRKTKSKCVHNIHETVCLNPKCGCHYAYFDDADECPFCELALLPGRVKRLSKKRDGNGAKKVDEWPRNAYTEK